MHTGNPHEIAVIGTGSWATALAQVLVDNGNHVRMYGIDEGELRDINERHRNSKYFGDIRLPLSLWASADPAETLTGAEGVVIAVPTRVVGQVLRELLPYIAPDALIINASKGFDPNTNNPMTQTIQECVGSRGNRVASLIGPSLAEEVIRRMLTMVCAVTEEESIAETMNEWFRTAYLRLYWNRDIIGAELGAAVKNVIAIASGILKGQGYGDNARAGLVTRGIGEMLRYGRHFGAKEETYFGLTGMGDLIVTCFSENSRNFQAGLLIGKNDGVAEFFAKNTKTVEGIYSCKVVYENLKFCDFDMPIVRGLYRVLYEGERPSRMIRTLMERPFKEE